MGGNTRWSTRTKAVLNSHFSEFLVNTKKNIKAEFAI